MTHYITILLLLLMSSCGNAIRLPRQQQATPAPVITNESDVTSVVPVDIITDEPSSLTVFVCMMLVVLLSVLVTAFVGRQRTRNKQPVQTNKPHVIRD